MIFLRDINEVFTILMKQALNLNIELEISKKVIKKNK